MTDTLARTSVFATEAFATYEADLAFTGQIAGGSPADPALVEGWLAKNLGITDEEQLKRWTMQHLAEVHGIDASQATDSEIEQAVAANATEKKAQVFKRYLGAPYIEPRQLKAMLKEAISIAYPRGEHKFGQYASRSVKRAGETVGGKEGKSFLAERVFPRDVPIVLADEVDGIALAVGHIVDQKTGERRSTIGYYEYIVEPTITVTLKVLDDCLDEEQWARIWTVAELNGLGARRSQGCGQFVVTRWEHLD